MTMFRSRTADAAELFALEYRFPLAVGLYVAHYNLCRVHEALRITHP